MTLKTLSLRSSFPPAITGVLVAAALGCAATVPKVAPPRRTYCALFDSLYRSSGFGVPVAMRGKATVDANQYRVRGIIDLKAEPSGTVYFEFTSSVLFGSQVEDFFFSVVDDTVRIVDRERGQYFEGAEAEEFLSGSLGFEFDARGALALALGGRPPCAEIETLRIGRGPDGGVKLEGRVGDGPFRVVFSAGDGKISEILWPVPGDEEYRDRLRASYEWVAGPAGENRLGRIVVWLEEREWRCRIVSTVN